MPYITTDERQRAAECPLTPGELNYAITKICLEYFNVTRACYTSINDVIGALECAKQEFYRRVAVPYEEKKQAENGDVY